VNLALKLNEAGNAALTFMLFFGMMYLFSFLVKRWHEGHDVFHEYADKAAVGIFTMFSGFMVKSAAGWYAIHIMVGTGRPTTSLPISFIFVIGTVLGLWGVICTVRALSPFEWRRYTWLWLGASSITFGAIFLF
jgi:hypothetical protein